MHRLKGKRSLITGAARGIGKGIAEAFAREGCAVAIGDIDASEARRTAAIIRDGWGVDAYCVEVDVGNRESVLRMVEAVTANLGGIDILVNNAGVSKVVPFLEMEESLWDATLDVNLKGTYLCCQAVLPQMVERRKGKIINMSSQSGKKGNAQYGAYCASKFGIIGLTQSLAQEFASSGININAICPGVVFTDLWQSPDMIDRYAEKRGIRPDEVEGYFKKQIPLGRLGTPEDVANVAVFLASDESNFMTGQALNVTGGMEMR
jgi:NAD(P)-dependent dehydrogenase (short-subunit alcohol dehydrogenase family)